MSTRAAAIAAWLAAALMGCGRSPVVRYYTLPSIATTDAGVASCPPALAVEVGPATLAPYLDRPEIATRASDTAIVYDGTHRWAKGLEAEVLDTLGRDLTTLLASDRVIVYPSEASFPLAFRVPIDVERFDAEPGGKVVLRVRWFVRAPDATAPLAVEWSEVVRSAATSSADDRARAYGDALGEVSRTIAARLCALAHAPAAASAH